MSAEQLTEFLAIGREQIGVEFKGAIARTDRLFFAKVTRAVLGMSNRRDGGYVVIGVNEVAGNLVPVGLNAADLATWTYDHVADGLAEYADPNVVFDLQIVQSEDNKFVMLRVDEFTEVPVLCRRTYQTKSGEVILREGACYVRPRRKPETVEVSTYADMRDLLDLATEKSTRRFVQRAHAAGLQFGVQSSVSDGTLFERERGDFS